MANRGFTLYQLTALARLMHSQGHSAINCTETDDVDQALGDTHDSHPAWEEWSRGYHALVAQPVREDNPCPKCHSVEHVTMGIPDVVRGAMLIKGATIVECGYCGYRISYTPR